MSCGILAWIVFSQCAFGWGNLLKDPGFDAYRLDPRGFYVLGPESAWQEITLGRGSVQFNANQWHAPKDMLRERPLGFSPGTTGFEGMNPDQNTGRIILQQDVVLPDLPGDKDHYYEAWIWLGGSGRDNDNGPDRKEEAGGWEVFFYGNTDTSTWQESNAEEYHRCSKDFYGKEGSFVQVSGFGKLPRAAKAFRMRVWASTWASASSPANYDTEVAVDNAHFAVIESPNMLINGDFELDDRPAEFKGWQRPAAWPFPRNGIKPLDMNNTYGENFDHGQLRPFYGARYAYGYTTYLSGWGKDAFTFSQFVDYDLPDRTPLLFMFNWIQNVAEAGKTEQLRITGTNIEVVIEYLRGKERLKADGFRIDWPVPQGAGAVGRYDQNAGEPYNPRFYLEPPAGTERIGVHVNFIVNMPYRDGFCHVSSAVDDFFLGPVDAPPAAAPAETTPGGQ